MKQFKSTLFCILGAALSLSAQNLKGQFHLTPNESQYRIYVKFKKELGTSIVNDKPVFAKTSRAVSSDLAQKISGLRFRQVLSFSDEEKAQIQSGKATRSGSEGFDRTAFSGLLELKETSLMPQNKMLDLAKELESLPEVEYVTLEPLHPIPLPAVSEELPFRRSSISRAASSTPDFTSQQDYLYGYALNTFNEYSYGVYATDVWATGITGQGVTIADIEWGFDYLHEEFNDPSRFVEVVPAGQHYDEDDHGTAVVGVMAAPKNGFGVTGIAYGMDKLYGISELLNGRTAAIVQSLDYMKKGDVLVFEMQQYGGAGGNYVPADWDPVVWDLAKQATDAGIIVVAAAGNGAENLDAPACNSYNARGDNGSIIVGACKRVGLVRSSFSTYGKRIDALGYGGAVVTAAYGGFYDGSSKHERYTNMFSGTSAATPIVAGAVALIQSYAKTKLGITVSPADMKKLIRETGTPGGADWGYSHVVFPNAYAAVQKLEKDSTGGTVVTTYQLTVNSGSGDGSYKAGSVVTITADAAPAGKQFDHWTGNSNLLADSTKATTTLTMGSSAATISALYVDDTAGTTLDTTNLSVNMIPYGGWSSESDTYGSTSTIDTTTMDSFVEGRFTTVADNVGSNEYSWSKMIANFENAFTDVPLFKITYSSDKPIRMVLEQAVLSDNGTSYGYDLPAGNNQTLYIPIDSFAQPVGIDAAQIAKLDLSAVFGIGFEAIEKSTTSTVTITELKAKNYTVGAVDNQHTVSAVNGVITAGLTARGVNLQIPRSGSYTVELYSLNGKKLFEETRMLAVGTNLISTTAMSKGIYLISIKGVDVKAVFKSIL